MNKWHARMPDEKAGRDSIENFMNMLLLLYTHTNFRPTYDEEKDSRFHAGSAATEKTDDSDERSDRNQSVGPFVQY